MQAKELINDEKFKEKYVETKSLTNVYAEYGTTYKKIYNNSIFKDLMEERIEYWYYQIEENEDYQKLIRNFIEKRQKKGLRGNKLLTQIHMVVHLPYKSIIKWIENSDLSHILYHVNTTSEGVNKDGITSNKPEQEVFTFKMSDKVYQRHFAKLMMLNEEKAKIDKEIKVLKNKMSIIENTFEFDRGRKTNIVFGNFVLQNQVKAVPIKKEQIIDIIGKDNYYTGTYKSTLVRKKATKSVLAAANKSK